MNPGPFTCTKEHFVYCGDPGEQGIPFEKVSSKTTDGLTIRGWYMPAGGTKAVVLAHGRGANRNEGIRFARVLHGAGYNLLTFDFRNCGESDKSFNSMGYHEKKDIYAAIDYLVALLRHHKLVAAKPTEWMPWNYTQALERASPEPPNSG